MLISGLLLALLGDKPARADIANPWVRNVVQVFAFTPTFRHTIESVTLFAISRQTYDGLPPAERAKVGPEGVYTQLAMREIEPPETEKHVSVFTPPHTGMPCR